MGLFSPLKRLIRGSKPESAAAAGYDYIIVGGGTAGCVLANRLTLANKKVLLVEAGSSDYKNKFIRIPAGVLRLFKSKFDWDFESQREANVDNRSIYICRGKYLGCSSCNNLLFYY